MITKSNFEDHPSNPISIPDINFWGLNAGPVREKSSQLLLENLI